MVKNAISRAGKKIVGIAAALGALIAAPTNAQWFEDNYPGYFSIQKPGLLQATAFGGGFVSDKYGVLQEGVALL